MARRQQLMIQIDINCEILFLPLLPFCPLSVSLDPSACSFLISIIQSFGHTHSQWVSFGFNLIFHYLTIYLVFIEHCSHIVIQFKALGLFMPVENITHHHHNRTSSRTTNTKTLIKFHTLDHNNLINWDSLVCDTL